MTKHLDRCKSHGIDMKHEFAIRTEYDFTTFVWSGMVAAMMDPLEPVKLKELFTKYRPSEKYFSMIQKKLPDVTAGKLWVNRVYNVCERLPMDVLTMGLPMAEKTLVSVIDVMLASLRSGTLSDVQRQMFMYGIYQYVKMASEKHVTLPTIQRFNIIEAVQLFDSIFPRLISNSNGELRLKFRKHFIWAADMAKMKGTSLHVEVENETKRAKGK
jgi:hypothetical protein